MTDVRTWGRSADRPRPQPLTTGARCPAETAT